MSLSTILGGTTVLFLVATLYSCGQINSLNQQIGEEREQCNTRIETLRAEKLVAAEEARSEARREGRIAEAELRRIIEEQRQELRAAERRTQELDTELRSALSRAQQEDKEWSEMLVPSYLLPD